MISSLKKVGLLSAACVLVSCSDSVDGVWKGECRNETVDSGSGLQMTIKQEGDKLHGVLMLEARDLFGSGRLTGVVIGKEVSICSDGNGETFVNITWSGQLKGDVIKGVYRVEPTPSAELMGRTVQKGSFTMTRQ